MDDRLKRRIIIASILLHIFLLVFWEAVVKLGFTDRDVISANEIEAQPIVFDLQQDQQDRPREVIETPDDAEVVEKQEKADFLSDKNALARNSETDKNLDIGDAYAKGDYDSHDLPVTQAPIGEKVEPQPEEQEEEPEKKISNEEIKKNVSDFFTEYMKKQKNDKKPGVKEHIPGVKHDNQLSRAEEMGGMSFNTYNWDFAPYMLALKKRIGGNITPPVAFTHLGIINGENFLRFRIYPDGKMENLLTLGYRGDKSLMHTSHIAIERSAPFPRLPFNFPEPYLEITCKFTYIIRKQ